MAARYHRFMERPANPAPPRPGLAPGLDALLRRMPKAELHLHLDGSLRPDTALELARERGLDEALDLAGMRARLRGPERALDQADLLRAFDLPIALLQDAESLQRVTSELVQDVAADGTRYVEIRWAPALHVARGLRLDDGIAAVVAGARDGVAAVAADGHDGPAVAGDGTGVPPMAGDGHGRAAVDGAPRIAVRLIAVAMRIHEPSDNEAVARAAARFAGEWLTGFDLAGPEAAGADPVVHRGAIEIARGAGLGITVHAGEWGGAPQVRRALDLHPSRIAHGSPAIDDPALVAELRDRGITLDLCPSSNVQASVVPSLGDHPLPRLLRAGVPVTLSTDDRTVSDVTLVEEYRRALRFLGLTPTELWGVDRHALRVAFLADDEPLRAALLRAFDAFAAGEPALRS